ncbi:hypothetical protein GCM10027418_11090 [Mariniluteicoccus endophyticus]
MPDLERDEPQERAEHQQCTEPDGQECAGAPHAQPGAAAGEARSRGDDGHEIDGDRLKEYDEQSPRHAASTAAGVRVREALLHVSRSQVVVAVVLGLLAMGFVMQVRARANDTSYATARRADLVQMADGLDAEARRLEGDLRALEETRRALESNRGSAEVARSASRARLDELAILAGTAPAQGPGVRITITDVKHKVDVAMLLDALEEMRDAGAEAIELNDAVRVVAQSWVGGTPGATTVDGRPVAGTIVLDVIGDPHALEEAARFRGGLATEVTSPAVGAAITIERSERIEVTSLHAVAAPQYARPAR